MICWLPTTPALLKRSDPGRKRSTQACAPDSVRHVGALRIVFSKLAGNRSLKKATRFKVYRHDVGQHDYGAGWAGSRSRECTTRTSTYLVMPSPMADGFRPNFAFSMGGKTASCWFRNPIATQSRCQSRSLKYRCPAPWLTWSSTMLRIPQSNRCSFSSVGPPRETGCPFPQSSPIE
jgi:hypothetical protein